MHIQIKRLRNRGGKIMTLAIQGIKSNPFIQRVEAVNPFKGGEQQESKQVQQATNPIQTQRVQPDVAMNHLQQMGVYGQAMLAMQMGGKGQGGPQETAGTQA